MFTKTRAIAAAAAASIVLSTVALSPASAAPLHNDGAAALGAFAAIAGTIAIIAASHHDDGPHYGVPYGYGYAPAPYGYAPHYGRWGGWHGHWHHR